MLGNYLVLRKLEVIGNLEGKKKLASKWDNLYKIVYLIDAKTYHLLNTIGKNLACA
jgi:hypothetical protein